MSSGLYFKTYKTKNNVYSHGMNHRKHFKSINKHLKNNNRWVRIKTEIRLN